MFRLFRIVVLVIATAKIAPQAPLILDFIDKAFGKKFLQNNRLPVLWSEFRKPFVAMDKSLLGLRLHNKLLYVMFLLGHHCGRNSTSRV